MNAEKMKVYFPEKNTKEFEFAEQEYEDLLKSQYVCTKYCRCCPYPGLKCVESGHPVR